MKSEHGPKRKQRPIRGIGWFTIVALGLLFVLALSLYFFSPEMLIPLRSFATHPITFVAIVLGLAIVGRISLPKAKREQFGFLLEAIIVASTIGLFLEVPHIRSLYSSSQEFFDIAGDWDYVVTTSGGTITHGGQSTIRQTRDGIYIDGHRLYNVHPMSADKILIPNGGNYWETLMVTIYGKEMKRIHFIYTIVLPVDTNALAPGEHKDKDRTVRAYCVLAPKGHPIDRLEGTYAHLAPGTLNGNIVFTKASRTQGDSKNVSMP